MKKFIRPIYVFIMKNFLTRIYQTAGTAAPITMKGMFFQKVLGFNRNAYWPVHHTSVVSHPENIKIGIGTAPGLSHGCYIQGKGKIIIGDYTIIAPNVGLISGNHDVHDISSHIDGTVFIGEYCWIGMNSVVLPNVTLGPNTIVAAGAVVTKSFLDGFCVLGGNPAKVIKHLDRSRVKNKKNKFEYYGYYKKSEFENFRRLKLNA
jgi:acetyltransferase-like isoleucine patch superfamily enzyme